jgi:hypothetical protein
MEAINSDLFDLAFIFLFVKKLFLGTVAFGFLIGGIYFASYLFNLYRLPRDSKKFRQQSEYLQKENLIRYIITIACMLVLSGLFYFGIEIGKESMHLGAGVWVSYYGIKHFSSKLKERKMMAKAKENTI